jgi:hypothetical protein
MTEIVDGIDGDSLRYPEGRIARGRRRQDQRGQSRERDREASEYATAMDLHCLRSFDRNSPSVSQHLKSRVTLGASVSGQADLPAESGHPDVRPGLVSSTTHGRQAILLTNPSVARRDISVADPETRADFALRRKSNGQGPAAPARVASGCAAVDVTVRSAIWSALTSAAGSSAVNVCRRSGTVTPL